MKRSNFLLTMVFLLFAGFTADAQQLRGDSDDSSARNVQRAKMKGEIAKIFAGKIKENKDALAQMNPDEALLLKEKWYEEIKTENGWYEFDQDEQSRYLQAQMREHRKNYLAENEIGKKGGKYRQNKGNEKKYRGKKGKGKQVATKSGRKILWNISAPKSKRPPLTDVNYPSFYGSALDKVDFGNDAVLIDVSELTFEEGTTPLERVNLEERYVIKELQRQVKERPQDAEKLRKAYSGIKKAYNFYEEEAKKTASRQDDDLAAVRVQRFKPQLEIHDQEGDIYDEDGHLYLSNGEFQVISEDERNERE